MVKLSHFITRKFDSNLLLFKEAFNVNRKA